MERGDPTCPDCAVLAQELEQQRQKIADLNEFWGDILCGLQSEIDDHYSWDGEEYFSHKARAMAEITGKWFEPVTHWDDYYGVWEGDVEEYDLAEWKQRWSSDGPR